MARPAAARIGIGALLVLGMSSCGTVESGQPDVPAGGSRDTAAAATSPAAADDSATGEGTVDGVVTPDTSNPVSTTPSARSDTADSASSPDASDPASSTTGTGSGTTTPQTGPPDVSFPAPTAATEPDQTLAPGPPSAPAQVSPSYPAGDGPVDGIGISQGAAFTTYTDRAMAITYDTQLVPEGSTINLVRQHGTNSTSMSVTLAGLLPDHEYAAHVHMDTCAKVGENAGPSYRNDPSLDTDPGAAVSAGNEIWLELATGAQGTARASTTVGWPIRPGEGYSLIIHAGEINTVDTEVNEQSERVACFVLARV
jgi:superoxide dismutase, Cu-Zn family